jgi:hypothetical protein
MFILRLNLAESPQHGIAELKIDRVCPSFVSHGDDSEIVMRG